MKSVVFQEDISEIISSSKIKWEDISDSSILVTGATGTIGNALTHALSAASDRQRLNLKIIAHGRSTDRGEALAKECRVRFVCGDIRKPIPSDELPETIDYVIHSAAVTHSVEMVATPVDVITTSVDGTKNILLLAKERQCKSMVYISSMEIYGQSNLPEVKESDLGYLDLSRPRSSYPESKRLCEALCIAYASQYGLPVKIARLAQTFGAGSTRDDTRVFAQFARSAISGKNIELHTEGKSLGNYCYTADSIRAMLQIMIDGKNGEAYNIANPTASATVREMAELVASEVCGGRIEVVVNIPEDIAKRGYAPDTGYSLNVDKLKALGWNPQYGLADMYRRTMDDWLQVREHQL